MNNFIENYDKILEVLATITEKNNFYVKTGNQN